MKTYTLTFRTSYTLSGLGRCRFSVRSFYWMMPLGSTPIEAFAYLLKFRDSASRKLRLLSCGCLVARSATYQGV